MLLVLIASVVLGSHAMHDSFAMIAWNAGGISPAAGGALWSESVAAEVVVFLGAGPWILRKLSPPAAIAIGACAAALRWAVMGGTTNIVALALVEPLHGLSFALFHLACMRIVVLVTPRDLAATAQAIYATGIALATALLTFASGYLYGKLGVHGFLLMAGLSLTSLPVVWLLAISLRTDSNEPISAEGV
jgi:PPP family 3-phenylpropionic acid transporter